MANRAEKSGINADMKEKMDAAYSGEDESKVRAWIEEVLGIELEGEFGPALQDGSKLCALLNKLQPGLVPVKFEKPSTMTLKQIDCVSNYLDGCRAYGMVEKDLFVTLDLVEGQNLNMVISSLFSLGRQAQKKGYSGKVIGPKEAEANPREFSEEKTREGRNLIGLQMGTNQVATQAGMTPYGKGRQIADTRSTDLKK